ncbi:hypothetical protein L1049_017497 [Liquidambar formosana]|uniref:Uncharacterized protein n=1 Tax=Liquidambar formosana TaxID=63359 RepID=A0AAP0S0X7_LIQFO
MGRTSISSALKESTSVTGMIKGLCPGLTHGQKFGISYLGSTDTSQNDESPSQRENPVVQSSSVVVVSNPNAEPLPSEDKNDNESVQESTERGSKSEPPQKVRFPSQCSVNQNEAAAVYPKPSEIPWKKELCNTVHLIGTVGIPIEFKLLNSGKALAWTRLGVRKSATDTTWINLTFWEEMAHTAYQHVEKGHRIYVSGRLVADTVEGDGEKQETYYKVVVQQLNFVENNFSSMSSYEHRKLVSPANNVVGSTQELWQAFFANPLDWWDNRKNKKCQTLRSLKSIHSRLLIDGFDHLFRPHPQQSSQALLTLWSY